MATLTANSVATSRYVRLQTLRKQTGTSVRGKTVKKMFNQKTSEEVAAELLHS